MSDITQEPHWERGVIEKLALDSLTEQRRHRRWGVFFKLLGFAYLTLILAVLGDWSGSGGMSDGQRHSALIDIEGVIAARGEGSAENVVAALQSAFDDKGAVGIILRINSPGGSPVQAGIIHDEIWRLRATHPDKPVHVVVEDICASGGYYVAAAADRIFVDKASIVGSIGVLMDGFGATGAMEKLGIERRLLTAGENKGFLDPFSPQNAQHKAHAQRMLSEIHQQFIEVVRRGRGTRLKETPGMFSGLMWTGTKSIELGLSDGYGTIDSVARNVLQAEEIRDYTVRKNFAERFAQQFGAEVATGLSSTWRSFRLQ